MGFSPRNTDAPKTKPFRAGLAKGMILPMKTVSWWMKSAVAFGLMATACAGVAQGAGEGTGNQANVAATPPMGWNSWDSYGMSITPEEWKANVAWFHEHLQPAGWQYVVIDEGWFLRNPALAGKPGQDPDIDANGQYVPPEDRFPGGLTALAEQAHAMGLKFGIHIVHGIPREAVQKNLPVAGTSLHAADAADTADVCQWNTDNYGVRDNAAGQAYYDGLLKLYAGWGVDLLKVDCISRPYNEHEIHMLRTAIDRSGRPMVLSLSPGPTPLADAADVEREGNMWRISDDFWDVWNDKRPADQTFPQTLLGQFQRLAEWMPYQQPGHWPDADMLPIGYLGPRPGWGEARESRYTPDETRTMLTLWSIARSPLILGANLTKVDSALEAMLTNREVIAVDQQGAHPRVVKGTAEGTAAWISDAPDGAHYVALFNLSDAPKTVSLPLKRAGLSGGKHSVRDLWSQHDLGSASAVKAQLPPHGSALFRVQ